VKVAVLSDIHANLRALEAVLAAIDADPPDELWCLGDVVGYGPKPNECCALMAARVPRCLGGNHDLAVRGTIDLADFAGDAGTAARWTREALSRESLAYIESLEPQGVGDDVALFHGGARDPVWEYVLTDEAALATFRLTEQSLVLVGHSHVALEVALRDGQLEGGLAPDGTEVDLAGARWILNPGSVGQPRDGDPRAAYLVVDFEARRAHFHRVAYDIAKTQAEFREAGLPEMLGLRLQLGQ
jgi:diadenosine tetraphosphatase ApaH/serine/threonine PP2A family protein phosphatase